MTHLPTATDPEVRAEQAYLDHAHRCLAAMRDRAARNVELAEIRAREEPSVDTSLLLQELEHRHAALAESPVALAFGRLDEERGDRFYVGRRHVEDGEGDEVVVDWRAAVSIPFYRATWADPMGIERRRRFALDGPELVGLFDEDLGDPATAGEGGGGVPDPLLAELERARTGEMRDIVATIQAEQDEVIRAPLPECLVVQGGPGTGKTAVGLHRAAFLLFEHRDRLERERLLVVGPNPLFLQYISQVLPVAGRDRGDPDDAADAALGPGTGAGDGSGRGRDAEGRRAHGRGPAPRRAGRARDRGRRGPRAARARHDRARPGRVGAGRARRGPRA